MSGVTLPIPAVTAAEMAEVDRLMVGAFRVGVPHMMELAGRHLARLALAWAGQPARELTVLVAVGRGNNGGGGLVAARWLAAWGASVVVWVPAGPLGEVPAYQRRVLEAWPVRFWDGLVAEGLKVDIALDALVGYGLRGALRGAVAEAVRALNALEVPVLALDVPSGLDATTGEVRVPCVRAAATLTLALPKVGLGGEAARSVAGALYLADIGVPLALYARMGLHVPPVFEGRGIVPLAVEGKEFVARLEGTESQVTDSSCL